jgi:hypothetical protein
MSAIDAHGAKADLEDALDAAGWPFRRSVSLWADALLVLVELAATS